MSSLRLNFSPFKRALQHLRVYLPKSDKVRKGDLRAVGMESLSDDELQPALRTCQPLAKSLKLSGYRSFRGTQNGKVRCKNTVTHSALI